MRKALIKVTYRCNNRCIYCHSEPYRGLPDLPTGEIKSRIRLAARQGAELAVFSGGEPTLRNDLPELAGAARRNGMPWGLITNGRRFVYPVFGEELARLGLRFAYVSFHSTDRAVHAGTTRTDSLAQTLAAVENLVKLGVEVVVNTVVTRRNLTGLMAVADRLAPLGPAKIKYSIVEPKGAALGERSAVPPLSEAAAAVREALRRGRLRHPRQAFGCEGLTPCLLEDFDSVNDDLFTNGFILCQEAFDHSPAPPDYANRSKPDACLDCAHWDRCPGVFRGYLSRTPAPVLRPEIAPRSNSFVFLQSGKPAAAPRKPSACPGKSAPGRRIFLAEGGSIRPFDTPTADFTPGQIEEALAAGRVFAGASVSPKASDRGSLRRLERAPLCRACPRKAFCRRLFVGARRDSPASLDQRLKKLTAGLRGDILEVGCGGVRFRPELSRLAAAGLIRYLGIDPSAAAASSPGLPVIRADAESFAMREDSFDQILLLGSYNHLRRPSAAFANIRRMLRPGGRLIVADSAAFGVVLPGPPAPALPAQFEHFRNHDAPTAASLLARLGFRPEAGAPEDGTDGACDWLLRLRKP